MQTQNYLYRKKKVYIDLIMYGFLGQLKRILWEITSEGQKQGLILLRSETVTAPLSKKIQDFYTDPFMRVWGVNQTTFPRNPASLCQLHSSPIS